MGSDFEVEEIVSESWNIDSGCGDVVRIERVVVCGGFVVFFVEVFKSVIYFLGNLIKFWFFFER